MPRRRKTVFIRHMWHSRHPMRTIQRCTQRCYWCGMLRLFGGDVTGGRWLDEHAYSCVLLPSQWIIPRRRKRVFIRHVWHFRHPMLTIQRTRCAATGVGYQPEAVYFNAVAQDLQQVSS